MPPKNKPKPDSEAVGVYDVEIMTEDELKQYIEALKEESERMKTSFIDHQRGKKEIEDLLSNTQEDILNQYETLMQKEIELQQLLSESNDLLKDEYKEEIIKDLETNKKLAQNMIDNFIAAQEVRMLQQDEVKSLQKNLEDREKEVSDINQAQKIISIDLKEQTEEEWANMMEKRETSLAEISKEFDEKYVEGKLKLFEEQENLMNGILNDVFGDDSVKYPSTNQAEKMSWYFKDLFWKNIKSSANLKVKVESLEKELKKLTMLLKDAEHENQELLKRIESKEEILQHDEPTVSKRNDFNDKQLEYLIYENYAFQEKLRQVTKERNILREKFISAIRSIYDKADFASFLADQLVSSLLKETKNRQPEQTTENPKEELLNAYLKEDEQERMSKPSSVSQEYDETVSDDNASSRTF